MSPAHRKTGRGAVVGGWGDERPDGRAELAAALRDELAGAGGDWHLLPPGRRLPDRLRQTAPEAAVVVPPLTRGRPRADEAAATFAALAASPVARVVALSSTEAYEPHHHHVGMVAEDYPVRPGANRISAAWRRFEAAAGEAFSADPGRLTVLRAAPVPRAGGDDFFSRLLAARIAPTVPGFDPVIQLLALADLAAAVLRAIGRPANGASSGGGAATPGLFNVVPAGVVPLRAALSLSGALRLPVPRWAQRLARRLAGGDGPDRVEFLRHPWTASGDRARRDLGFKARLTSAEAARAARGAEDAGLGATGGAAPGAGIRYDDFGVDAAYVEARRRTWLRWLHDVYWRVESRGLEHVPRTGRAVLVGVHRGFMPFDGVMALHLIVGETGRIPRFLLHPTLVKFPFLSSFMRKLGGVMACAENADRILSDDGLLAIYPEGIRGAFTPYRRAYRLGKFGRDEYVRMALRNRSPLVPFVTVGSAEIFPIVGRIDWRWWKRYSEWPYFPITSPVPLPSKWHTLFLSPEHVEREHPPEAADDPEVVAAISRRVRRRMAVAIEAMRVRRPSIFRGSVFEGERLRPLAGDGGGGLARSSRATETRPQTR